ncbi:tyrosine-type recombinase/integrase [Pseudomonas aeruginosa]|uniref:tyrosine-type recombinase/integrase n=1 Tax=Pseudomonas aeruginosa TaxID=287 RepID=UPI00155287E7|nr:integrase arm-type DNA-binding domain-containing protein [Pseudomonas aeruginosa]QKF01661.1 tyrosine-type recombinase/integrase [Pseudomonas aeruginosa]HCF1525187.1 tyrosine-type recombinase/integrase [Pseudomonas aeruginosa]
MALTDFSIRHARPTGKDYTLRDSDGLSLAVSAKGGRSWHFRYYWATRQQRMSLGTYPEISLREARELRDEARALLAKGINPKIDRKQKFRAACLAAEHSFKSVYLQWLAHRKLELKEGRQSTLSQIQRIFDKNVLPTLGSMSIYNVRRADLLEVIARVERRKAFTTAEKVRTWFRQLFRYALVKVEGLEGNPASDLDAVAVPVPPVVNNPFLRLEELPDLLRKLRRYDGKVTTQLGIRLLLLTGVRTGELRQASPDQFDLERGLWIIPAEVVKQLQDIARKRGKRLQDIPPYIVPLSVQAIEIARYLLAQVKPAQRYLLPHRSDLKKRISENTLNAALKRMGYEGLLTGHGIRATISTALNEIGYLKTWVDAQLSHADPNKVSATYNHALYVEPRRKMVQDWADRLDLLEQGDVGAASAHLSIRIDGMPVLAEGNGAAVDLMAPDTLPVVVSSVINTSAKRLSAVPAVPEPVAPAEVAVSDFQRERMEMLEIYEAPHNLPVVQFARLAGKSRDQINREIKAGKLLTLNVGNRGQRIPDWQLDPLKLELVRAVLQQIENVDSWQLYRLLLQPHETLGGRSVIEAVISGKLDEMIQLVSLDLAAASSLSEEVA